MARIGRGRTSICGFDSLLLFIPVILFVFSLPCTRILFIIGFSLLLPKQMLFRIFKACSSRSVLFQLISTFHTCIVACMAYQHKHPTNSTNNRSRTFDVSPWPVTGLVTEYILWIFLRGKLIHDATYNASYPYLYTSWTGIGIYQDRIMTISQGRTSYESLLNVTK